MKKQLILGIFLGFTVLTTAQNFNTTGTSNNIFRSGKTGFGMSTAPANNILEIETSQADDGLSITQKNTNQGWRGSAAIYLKNVTGHNWGLFSMGLDNNIGATHFAIYDLTTSSPRLFIHGSNGNVGIGTTNPLTQFQINTSNTNDGVRVNQTGGTASVLQLFHTQAGAGNWGLLSYGTGKPDFAIYDYNYGYATYPFYINGSTSGVNDPYDGYVGIGTSLPNRKLSVDGDVSFGAGYGLTGFGPNGIEILGNGKVPTRRGISTDTDPNGHFDFFINNWQSANGIAEFRFKNGIVNNALASNSSLAPDLMKIDGNGKVTINNFYPNTTDEAFVIRDGNNINSTSFKVSKNGNVNIKVPNTSFISGGPAVALGIYQNDQTTGGLIGQVIETDYSAGGFQNTVLLVNRDDTKAFSIHKKNGNGIVENFLTMGSGHTYIGVKKAGGAHSDAMLSVYGKIVATSCYITVADWADYVFDKNYKLPNLYEIENFYKEHKHLPEIPSEKEVIENGVDVAEMNKLLLKKIEEMTILMVKQQRDIDLLKEKIK